MRLNYDEDDVVCTQILTEIDNIALEKATTCEYGKRGDFLTTNKIHEGKKLLYPSKKVFLYNMTSFPAWITFFFRPH